MIAMKMGQSHFNGKLREALHHFADVANPKS